MNILYIMQQSIYGNDKKWKTADSNIQMGIGIIKQLLNKTHWTFYVLIGFKTDFSDIEDYKELIDHPRVNWVEFPFPIDAFLNRYNFDVQIFDMVVAKFAPKIDVVWNNIIELSRNIKTWMFARGLKAKLISCNYWMDCPEINEAKVDKSISYDWRQFDGFECSDLCVFTCESTKKAFIDNSRKKFNKKYVDRIISKSTIWDFGFSAEEVHSQITEKWLTPTILFANRLSGINYSHHKEFIESLKKVDQEWIDYQVVFANPSLKISFEELEKQVKNIHLYSVDVLSRWEYLNLLWKTKISVHLYTMERYGGCAMREALAARNIIVCPKVFEYRRILGERYPFYCKNDFSDLSKVLIKAIQYSFTQLFQKKGVPKDILDRNFKSSFEFVKDRVIDDIKFLTMK